MQLGQRLLKANLISTDQLKAALHAQSTVGGRIGTCLIRMGALDFDTLSWVLGEHTGVPAAKLRQFERIETSTLERLPGPIAQKHYAIPMYVKQARGGKDLAVALRDPKALAALDEIALVSGARLLVHVAPEQMIVNFLERLYGIPAEVEVRGRAQGARNAKRPISVTPAALEKMMGLASEDLPSPAKLPQIDDASRVPSIDLPFDEPVDFVPTEAFAPASGPEIHAPYPAAKLNLEEALSAIDGASSKTEVADAVIGYLRSSFEAGLLLLVKDGIALGWKGFGPKLDPVVIEAVTVPLTTPSMLGLAWERRSIFRGPPPKIGLALQSRLFRLLHAAVPEEVLVAPIVINQRVTNLIYVHGADGKEMPEGATADLLKLAKAAAEGFVRVIRTTKARASVPPGPASVPPGPASVPPPALGSVPPPARASVPPAHASVPPPAAQEPHRSQED
jgi:hypothetical protein